MKTTIGGDRLGSGNKQEMHIKNFERSTHDLGYLWRSSMSAGTLVPFMSEIALPGDSFDIDLNCEVLTLPTVGPLFGSYKVQLDVFQVPIRLYQGALHMNKLGIGMDMSAVKLPQIKVLTNNHANYQQSFDDNEHIHPSSLLKYLGISGLGKINGLNNPAERNFNAVPYLGFWEIYKQYYANKQEERGFCVHTSSKQLGLLQQPLSANLYRNGVLVGDILLTQDIQVQLNDLLIIQFKEEAVKPLYFETFIVYSNLEGYISIDNYTTPTWHENLKQIRVSFNINFSLPDLMTIDPNQDWSGLSKQKGALILQEFPLENIDTMRENLLSHKLSQGTYYITKDSIAPYGYPMESIGDDNEFRTYSTQYTQECLPLKTYQSDLFNNWISTEWLDGTNGVNEITAVSTAGGSFSIDSLNLATKVYNMLNRIALSGGTYDDWLDAVYTEDRVKQAENPIYLGSLIKELAFQEVISNAGTNLNDETQPLGTLGGRGVLTDKHKGGKISCKISEPSYLMGIVSITPRIEYSQGNKWDTNLLTLNDLHKPSLDAIGYQDLITDQMHWADTQHNNGVLTFASAGKQPAWINYMTNYNRCYGNFADKDKDMFMTLNRRYEVNSVDGISDLTTYIDPTKFNHIFAQTNLDAQNFWVQISNDITLRRKISAKVIPNL